MTHRALYEITGDIKDVNTLLIPRSYFGEAESDIRYNLWWGMKDGSNPWLQNHPAVIWKICESYIKDGK